MALGEVAMSGRMWALILTTAVAAGAMGAADDTRTTSNQDTKKAREKKQAKKAGQPKAAAKQKAQTATPAETLKVLKDFKVELLYSVPKETQGSWVNMCVDPKGRLIVSDQYGPLYRITPPSIGGKAG